MPSREQVFQALFAQLNGKIAGVNTYSRRFTLPAQVKADDAPRLMVWEHNEESKSDKRLVQPVRTWHATIVVTFFNGDSSVAGATIINPIIEAIEAALGLSDPTVSGQSPAGGYWLRIDGETQKETGDTDARGLGGCAIPLKITVP